VVANKLLINSNAFDKAQIHDNLRKLPVHVTNLIGGNWTYWIDCVTEENSKLNKLELFINVTRLSSLVSSHSFYQNCQLTDLITDTDVKLFRQVNACAKVLATVTSTVDIITEKINNDTKKPKLDAVNSNEEIDFLTALVLDDGLGTTIIGIVTKTTVSTSADCHINQETHTVWLKCGIEYNFILSKLLFPYDSSVEGFLHHICPGNNHIYRIHTMS